MVPSLRSFNLSGQIRQSRPLPMAWTARGAGSRSRAARRPSSGRIPSSTRRSRRRRAAPEPPRACSAPLLPPPSEPPHGVDGVKLLRCVPRPRPLRRPATGSKLQPPHHLLSSPAPISSSPFPSSRNLLSPPGFLPAAPLSPPDPAAGQRLSSNPAPQGLFYVHQGTIKADTMADAPAGDAGEAEMDPMLDPTRKPLRSNDQVQVAASATATTCPKPSSGTANKRSKTAVHLDGAALFLNQGKFYPIMKRGDDELVGELRGCFNDVLGKMIEDEEIQNKIDQQAVLYENQRGPFSNVMAMQNIGTRNPHCFGEKKREEQVGMQSVLLGQPPGFIARAYRLVLLGDESALAATAEEARSCAAGGAAAVAVVGRTLVLNLPSTSSILALPPILYGQKARR